MEKYDETLFEGNSVIVHEKQSVEARKFLLAGLNTMAQLDDGFTYSEMGSLSNVALAQFKAAELLRLGW